MAQRLVRTICPNCKEVHRPPDLSALRKELGEEVPDVLYRGRGCRNCQGTGYRGRTGVFEFMVVTEGIRALILEGASTSQLRRLSIEEGMRSLRRDGWRHVAQGMTTIEELLRVTKDEPVNRRSSGAGINTVYGTRMPDIGAPRESD